MGSIGEKDLLKYYKEIEKTLACDKKQKQSILHNLDCNVQEYREQNPNASLEEIITHFGEPKLFAGEMLASLDEGELNTKMKKAKNTKQIVVICCAVVLLVALFAFGWMIVENRTHQITYADSPVIQEG